MGQVHASNISNPGAFEEFQTYHSTSIDINWGLVARIGAVVLAVIGSIALNAVLFAFAPPILAAIIGAFTAGIAIGIIRICFSVPCH